MPGEECGRRVQALGAQDVGARRGLRQHGEIAAGHDGQGDQGDIEVEDAAYAEVPGQPHHAVAVAVAGRGVGIGPAQMHDQAQVLVPLHRGVAEHLADVEHTQAA